MHISHKTVEGKFTIRCLYYYNLGDDLNDNAFSLCIDTFSKSFYNTHLLIFQQQKKKTYAIILKNSLVRNIKLCKE